jgi:hypothetical protein
LSKLLCKEHGGGLVFFAYGLLEQVTQDKVSVCDPSILFKKSYYMCIVYTTV